MSDVATKPEVAEATPAPITALEHSFHHLLGFAPETDGGQQVRAWATYQEILTLDHFFSYLKPSSFTYGQNSMGYTWKNKKDILYLKELFVKRLESLWNYLHLIIPNSSSVYDDEGNIILFYPEEWLKQTAKELKSVMTKQPFEPHPSASSKPT
jgi:hypothetical protein